MNFFHRSLKKLKWKHKIALIAAGVILMIMFVVAVALGPFRVFFWDIPGMLGFFGPRHYLVLLQNNNELRPAGGFISGYGVVKMFFGFPRIEFHDSYNIATDSYVTPPYPFEKLIGDDDYYNGWQFRDANFSPDFPTSAEQVIAFYKMQFPKENFSAVVALDFSVIEDLINVLGGINVADEKFTKENFFLKVQRASKNIDLHNEEALKNRKSILSDLASSLVWSYVQNPWKARSAIRVVASKLDEKHIQIFAKSNSLKEKIAMRHWDGAFEYDVHSDFLHVNTANIGGRKADRYVQKQFEYTLIFPRVGPAKAKMVATYTHQGDYNLQSDRYQAFVRAYVPLGSNLKRAYGDVTDDVQIIEDLGLTVFGNTIVMMPGERRTIIYEYELPATVVAEDYVLELIKQAGTDQDNYVVTVRMPNDHTMTAVGSDKKFKITENVAVWKGALDSDSKFALQLQPDVSAPLIQWQEFRGTGTIVIRFNEQIDSASVAVLSNFDVTDLNIADSQFDNVVVTAAYVEGLDLFLRVSGVRNVPNERFRVLLKNIKDLSGNFMNPSPFELTVVQ